MADIEIKVPSLGESESEATLVSWLVNEGDAVAVDDVLAEIESDKITMEITAFDAGVLKKVFKQAGATVTPGEVVAIIAAGDSAKADKGVTEKAEPSTEVSPRKSAPKEKAQASAAAAEEPVVKEEPAAKPVAPPASMPAPERSAERLEERVPMSRLRQRIAERLKFAQNTAAMLTTFNEVNLQAVMDLRTRYGAAFLAKHGIKLGFMSFFVRAVSQALARYPALNAYIDGDDIVYHNYVDAGIAVSTDKGLVVPVLRDAHRLSLAGIEIGIADLANRARDGHLMPDDLKGGTFSITNGGVFGSMLSTPILNPPQSGILGMHTIQKRAVVENDAVVIRPMMYLALSYDHRLIDGAEAVRFLVAVKESLEFPGSLTLDI
ncbi:MAG TPA: dihydrolipoyllysine-residue succinyltransferase [Mariprofundaceae bacterium]|nr:dihydrolipoyllysine-residue succinyltransferase [Mariprofundaceae bacterium]